MGRKLSKAEKARQRRAEATNGGNSGRGGAAARGRAGARDGTGRSSLLSPDKQVAFESRKRTVQLEESAFSKLSPPILEKLSILAAYAVLQRPIQPETAQFGWQRFGKARVDHGEKMKEELETSRQGGGESHHLSKWLASSIKDAGSGSGILCSDAQSDNDDEDDPSSSNTTAASIQHGSEQLHELRLPKRPRWRSDMDTKTVQSNEDEVFCSWLRQTDAVVEHAFFTSSPLFRDLQSPATRSDYSAQREPEIIKRMGGSRMTTNIVSVDEICAQQPRPATAIIGSLYERNVEVFRQLWRVCERSDLVCVLADARCPPLHLPPSLTAFLERYMRLKVVIVLTKADIVPAPIVEAWKVWLQRRFPSWEVVGTESYTKMERMEGQGARTRYAPYLSPQSRSALFAALRKAHHDLVQPPPTVRDDPARLKAWTPPCATEVDWEGIERRVSQHSEVGSEHEDGGAAMGARDNAPASRPQKLGGRADPSAASSSKTSSPPPFLTVGLIGQPNVGKSSLLNALFGSKVVRASKTPGKTKHFQTHFLSPSSTPRPDRYGEIRLCDSPGLVFPSLVGMEMQVMGAILPISQVQALSSVVRFVGQHMPLERVAGVSSAGDDVEEERKEWTSVAILERVAEKYGWRTAKANRWDVNRAGNAVMRAVAEGRVKWAFRPPLSPSSPSAEEDIVEMDPILDEAVQKGDGVWLEGHAKSYWDEPEKEDIFLHRHAEEAEGEGDEEGKKVRFQNEDGDVDSEDVDGEESKDEEEEEEEDEIAGREDIGTTTSRFAALMVNDGDDDDDGDDYEEEDEKVEEEEEKESHDGDEDK